MQSLGVALVLEFKAKVKLKKFKSEVELEEIKMDELSVMVKIEN